jgi:putative nucleotidyltransferase with HDIG domain
MIKKIRADQLRVGVYIHDINTKEAGEQVFIKRSLIQTHKAIQIIRSWGIEEVYIDTEKGLDIKSKKSALEVQQEIDRGLRTAALQSLPPVPTVSLKEELSIARSIKEEAVNTMQRAMKSVSEGTEVDLGAAYQLVEKMEKSVTRNRDALLLLTRIRKKDEYTLMHSISVSSLVLAFCNFCGLAYDTTLNMAMGALFHDIGKTRIPLGILNKPGKLDTREMAIIKKHTEHSADVLANTKDLPFEAFDIALHHHERFDGSGYPHGLKGVDIGFASRIAAICDVFDAITSERCYKNGIDRVAGLRLLYEWSETHFDKELAYKFIGFVGVYPIGTCVRLENDLVGVVTGSTDKVLQPVVRLFYNNKTRSAMQVREVDLCKAGINVVNYESPNNWDAEKLEIYKKLKSYLNPVQHLSRLGIDMQL